MFCFTESYCFTKGIDHEGNDLTIFENVFSFTHCQWECQQNDACVVFGLDMNNGRCVLKSQENPTANGDIESGPKFCNDIKSEEIYETIIY